MKKLIPFLVVLVSVTTIYSQETEGSLPLLVFFTNKHDE